MGTTTMEPTYSATGELDFDPATMTVRADDGGRIDVFDLDSCPLCDGHLTHVVGWFVPNLEQVMCVADDCGFYADRVCPERGGEGEARRAEIAPGGAGGSMATRIPSRRRKRDSGDCGASGTVATEDDALAFWLGTKKRLGFVQTHGGIGWHVRDGRGQNVKGLPDVLMLLPKRDGSTLLVALEIKTAWDRVSDIQRDALGRFYGVSDSVVGIVRYGRIALREMEMTQDEAVAAIERALTA